MPTRRCIDCGRLTTTTRCDTCRRAKSRARDAQRGTPTARGYDARHYRDRAKLLATNPPCHWCGTPGATIADHIGNREARTYVPACVPCNARRTTRTQQGTGPT